MKSMIKAIPSKYLGVAMVVSVAVLMTLGYDFGWRVGLPIEIRNLFGLILFSLIMAGGGIAYYYARHYGSDALSGVKISLIVPILWHIKEMSVAANIYGLGQGIYAGLQGPYLFYYCSTIMIMGIFHFLYELQRRSISINHKTHLLTTGYFVLPMCIVGGIEGLVMVVFGFDIFVFQGFLSGYRFLFS